MTDEAVRILKEDGSIDSSNDLVVIDKDGNTESQGTRMIERESYECLIEGLRIAAEAAHLLGRKEPSAQKTFRLLALKLDQCRRACVQKAGLGLAMAQTETRHDLKDSGLSWRNERQRFREGLEKASGAAKQLAVYFRADMEWLFVSNMLETMTEKLKVTPNSNYRPDRQHSSLMMPGRDF